MTIAACRGGEPDRPPGHLLLRLNSNPTTLDPALITDVQGGTIAAKLFNGLVRFNEDLAVVPDIARSWSISPDRVTYTFRLRTDARFSNGRRVTSQDVRYSFERVLSPATRAPLTWVLDRIEGAEDLLRGKTASLNGIRTPDDRTVVIRLRKPFGPFLSLLAMTTAYIVPREEVERLGADFGSNPVGSGPFVLQEWKHGQYLTLRALPDHVDGASTVIGIRYRIIPEDLTAVMEFDTGRLDVLLIPAAEFRRYSTDPATRDRVHGMPGLNSYYLGMNCTHPPFNDVRVRRAVNMAVDRNRILNTIFEKRGVLATGPVPAGLREKGPPAPWPREGYRYDPVRARSLIREAGAEGAEVTIFISADAEVLDIVEVIQDYMQQVGLRANIVQLDWSAFKQTVTEGKADAFWLSWWADYPDPENFFTPLFHSRSEGAGGNRTRCRDTDLDSLIDRSQGTPDKADRYRLYARAEERIISNAPWVFMWHRSDYYVVQPWVRNFRIYPIYSIEKRVDVRMDL